MPTEEKLPLKQGESLREENRVTIMSNKYHQVASLLMDVEATLRTMGVWSNERPSDAALASETPFCIDTLSFEQWLQFIFIERMTYLVEQNLPLPDKCGIAPMAEVRFRELRHNPSQLITHLEELDRILNS